ncbi:hypothetical protein [Frigoribacterium salinisoli]
MGRARAGGVAAVASLTVGAVVAVSASRRLVQPGDAGADGARLGSLDLVAVAVLLLGLAVALGGVTIALVALADRGLGRLGPDAGPARPAAVDAEARPPTSSTRTDPPVPAGAPAGEPRDEPDDGRAGGTGRAPRTGYSRALLDDEERGPGRVERPTARVAPVVLRPLGRPPVGVVAKAPTVAAARGDGPADGSEDVGRRPA